MSNDKKIDEFLGAIRPLDILVFKGGDFVSEFIRKIEGKYAKSDVISHVEIAMSKEYCAPIIAASASDGTMLSWGSTMSGDLNDGVDNVETGKAKFGVQFRDLRELIKANFASKKANIGYARLLDNPIARKDGESDVEYNFRIESLKIKLASCYDKYANIMYNANPISLLATAIPKLRPLRDCFTCSRGVDKKETRRHVLFCSEFVASLCIDLGIISDDTDSIRDGITLDPRNILPVDFVGGEADGDGIIVPICAPIVWLK